MMYGLPLSSQILDNEGEGKTMNEIQYNHGGILQSYSLDLPLDLISRYTQLHHLAHGDQVVRTTVKNSCVLYVQNHIFNQEFNPGNPLFDSTWNRYNQARPDDFLNTELSLSQRKNLYQELSGTFGNCFFLSEVYMVLDSASQDPIKTDFNQADLDPLQSKLYSISDSRFIEDYYRLYHITYSRLFYEKSATKLRYHADSSRSTLLDWKAVSDSSIGHYNQGIGYRYANSPLDDSLYTYIKFDGSTTDRLFDEIIEIKQNLANYFNRDIYPDFKRIFYNEQKNPFFFDSLTHYSSLYSIPLNQSILSNDFLDGRTVNPLEKKWEISEYYSIHLALDLISRYLQLNYIAYVTRSVCDKEILIKQHHAFQDDLNISDPAGFKIRTDKTNEIAKDEFFRKELSFVKCQKLFLKIKSLKIHCPEEMEHQYRGPNKPIPSDYDKDGFRDNADRKSILFDNKHYFPIPVPFPSAYKYIPNFKPLLKSIKEVDQNISTTFNTAGYKGHTHYYYVKFGYAMTTNLERINEDGSPVKGSQRWQVDIAGLTNPTMYTTFKSIFMKTEVELRMFAFVIMPAQTAIQSNKGSSSIGAMQNLIEHSYTSLPKDIESMAMDKKTLTILVYHYHQDDVGQVPMLDTSNKLSVDDHLIKSGLGALLKN